MNVDVACPQCGTVFTIKRELLGKRSKCTICGSVFTLADNNAEPSTQPAAPTLGASSAFPEIPAALRPEPPDVSQFTVDTTPRAAGHQRQLAASLGFEQESSWPRFPALRMVARAYEVMAVISFVLALLVSILFLVDLIRQPDGMFAVTFTESVAVSFGAIVASVTMLFAAQFIRLCLQVEQNTRETHLACRQLADHLCSVETER